MSNFPTIKIAIIFILGILFQHIFNFSNLTIIIVLGIITSLIFLFMLIFKKIKNQLFTLMLLLYLFCTSAIYFNLTSANNIKYPFHAPKIRNAVLSGTVVNIDLLKNQKLSLQLNLHQFNDTIISTNKKLIFTCNFWKDTTVNMESIYDNLKIGNSIKFIGTISRAKNDRNPGEFNYEEYLLNKGISGIVNCYKLESLELLDTHIFPIKNAVFSARKNIYKKISTIYGAQSSSLLKGILLADRSDIDYNIRTSFVNSGVVHVLAVSGLHVGFISGIFFLLLARFHIKKKYIITIIGIILFLIITGGHASVFRASTMAIVYLIAKLTNRSTNGYNSIAIAALIILLLNPKDLFAPGFLLSFSAVLSILIIYPILSAKINELRIHQLLKKILLFFSVSFAAQIGTLPLTLIYFNKLSLIALLANLFVIPVIGLIVAVGIFSIILSPISFLLAKTIAFSNEVIIKYLYLFIDFISNLSFSFIPIYNFTLFDSILFYAFLGLALIILTRFRNKWLGVISITLLLFSFSSIASLNKNDLLPNGKLSIVAIDVGQGDSFLIKFPNNKTALIDAGNATEYFDNGTRVILPLINRLGIDTINNAFISHLDSDHYAGYITLIEKGIIQNVVKPSNENSIKDSVFEEYLDAFNVGYEYYSNTSMEIDNCKIYFLNDTTNYLYNNFDSNNKSGIIKIVYGKNSFLFVGDAEHEAEEYLVERYSEFLKADVLKVGHHGSKTSSSDEFLELVDPKIGIISAGIMNKFKHPSKVVIDKFKHKNVVLRRTDYEGAIIITSDGENITNIDWRK